MTPSSRLAAGLIALLLLVPAASAADHFDLGPGVSDYRRFLVYPHLQKGLAALAAGRRDTALAELRRAHEILPGNPVVAQHYAHALARFGDRAGARHVLEQQLRATPEAAAVQKALASLRRAAAPVVAAAAPATTVTATRGSPAGAPPPPRGSGREPVVATSSGDRQAFAPPTTTPSPAGSPLAMLEVHSYQLMSAGKHDEALQLLLANYPFADAETAPRQILLQRLALLSAEPARLDAAARARLATPLETPSLRGAQSAIFMALQDCTTVRQLLGDLAAEYGPDDWLRLGECYRATQPGLAQHAYAMAWKRRPDGLSARALAHQAFANRDYDTAVTAWRSLTPETLTADDLAAGITTAVTAGDMAFANEWLGVQARRFGTDSETYWWRLAQAAQSQTQAEEAVREAIARQPRPDYYLLLASLRQRTGDDDGAIASLRAALALEPGNDVLRLQLAYACAGAGRLDEARSLFEEARAARPGDRQLTEQLVYLAEQQGDFVAARRYAGEAIELRLALPPADIAADSREADTLFGLRRLHENLGRRWSLNADLFTGAGLVSAGTAPSSRTTYRSYLQLEAEYRLEAGGLRPRLLAPYARLFAGSGEEDSALPVYSPMLGAGLRLRPWRGVNVALALEQQVPLDHGPDVEADLMLRASGSFLDSGRFSGDWHAAGSGWTSQSLYLDMAYFADAGRSAGTADYRLGYHRKAGDGRTLEPYAHLQYNVIEADTRDEDVRAGIGLRWNRWFGETRLDAWRHKASVGLEYQHAFQSWLTDKDSLSLNLGLHW